MTRLPITLCVNTRNAAEHLRPCIESCRRWVTEVVVVDMESEDDTADLARSLGARVISIPAAGIVEAGRQVAIDAASQPWALVLDADERASEGLTEVLERYVAADTVNGVYLPMKNYLFGKHIRHSAYWPDWQMRFFRPDHASQPRRVHSRVQIDGPTAHAPARVSNALVHLNYDTIFEWLERNNRYTEFEAEQLAELHTSASLLRLTFNPVLHFLKRYVWFRGYRDGRHGLVIALLMATYYLVVEMKLWQRQEAVESGHEPPADRGVPDGAADGPRRPRG